MARRRRSRSRAARRQRPRTTRKLLFYAYPSHPAYVDETIRAAQEDLKKLPEIREQNVRIRLWPDMSISGRVLVSEITKQIDRSVVFACDVTYPNPNVAFELGYAIGSCKRIWLSLDTSIKNAKLDFNRSYTGMLGIGYASYENHVDLTTALRNDHPWTAIDQNLLGDNIRSLTPTSEDPTLLYVMPPFSTGPVVAIREHLERSVFSRSLFLDDPSEISGSALEWYAEKVKLSDVVLVHFLSDQHRQAAYHNVKASWVSGLAHAMQKPLLLLAHIPFAYPTDIQTLLRQHESAQSCIDLFEGWTESFEIPRRRRRRPLHHSRGTPDRVWLRDIALGEPVAENERYRLDQYFVETSSFSEALSADVSIFVGRKGTGKTASLVALDAEYRRDKRNHVCTVQPVGYEVDGLLRLLAEDWHSAERGFLIESLWKFLIYTELAASVRQSIEARPLHYDPTDSERRLLDHVAFHHEVLLAPFSQRLNRAVLQLTNSAAGQDSEAQRARISEQLHIEHLGQLRRILGSVLADRERVVILIDNLDHQWRAGTDTLALSSLLLGLLQVTQDIVHDFRQERHDRRRVNVSLTSFIRSDIFTHLEPLAAEQDKWPIRRISWNDPDLLIRVIDERFEHGGRPGITAEEIWTGVFPEEINDQSAKDFILGSTLPRPRDVIFLVKEAIAVALNRNHDTVTEQDMLVARKRYSSYVFGSVLAEDDPLRDMMEPVLFEFAGAPKTLKESDVRGRIERAGVPGYDIDFYVELLCDVNFLGIFTASGYAFSDDENERRMLLGIATRLAFERGLNEVLFVIHPAFHDVLQVE